MTVALADAPAKARSGMTADVTITTRSATGVLAVPAAALRGSERQLQRPDPRRERPRRSRPRSTVGLVTSTLAEIKSGLTEGTAVVTGTSGAAGPAPRPRPGGFGGAFPAAAAAARSSSGGGNGRGTRTTP